MKLLVLRGLAIAAFIGGLLLMRPDYAAAVGTHRARACCQASDVSCARASEAKAKVPMPQPPELLLVLLCHDGGSCGARLRHPTGELVEFCIASPDAPPIMFADNRIYVGAMNPMGPHARLVPAGSDEEARLIKGLESAMAPHLTEEGKRAREGLPDKNNDFGRYRQLDFAEGMLGRLHKEVAAVGRAAGPTIDQATAIAGIKRGGGVVGLDEKRPDKPAIMVDLKKTEVTDAGLEYLVKDLTQLRLLELGSTKVTDAGLEHLRGLTQLRLLDLLGTRVTDAGVEHLKGFTQLQTLWLDATAVTDAGLAHLQDLTQLQRLGLGGTKVTDAGLQHLKGLKQLRSLWLLRTRVTEAGVKNLQQALPDCKIEWEPPTKDERQRPTASDQLR